MTQKAEGINVTRQAAIEQSDGSLLVAIRVLPADKSRFFELHSLPGDPMVLIREQAEAAPEAIKPPAQRIAPAGADVGGAMGQGLPAQLAALCRHPWFQSYANAQEPSGKDAEQHAKEWLDKTAQVGQAGYADAATQQRVKQVLGSYVAWATKRFGIGCKPLPW